MRKFLINVNGNSYEIEVEEITDGISPVSGVQKIPQTPAGTPAATSALTSAGKAAAAAPPIQQPAPPAPAAPAAAPAPTGDRTVNSPMPGTILGISVNQGDVVKKGQVLCILEAMKMENDIFSPYDGRLASVHISQGDSVNAGQLMFVFGE